MTCSCQPRYISVNTKHCVQRVNISHIQSFRPAEQGADFKTVIIMSSGDKIYSLDHQDYIVVQLTRQGAIFL
jgi:hypothetical protein